MRDAKSGTYDLSNRNRLITLFLSGDVMPGRGIDQILPHPSDPKLYESYVKDARVYVDLAESVNGPIPKPADHSYIWGDALDELTKLLPSIRIINLETSITSSDDYWRGKGINYRMHPKNIVSIEAAQINVCVLANNHVLDWGYSGLTDTLETLKRAAIKTAGAGLNLAEAEAPAIWEIDYNRRVLVFSFGSVTSGILVSWAALPNKPGVNLLKDYSNETVRHIEKQVKSIKRSGDIAVASIHWGGNWGYTIYSEEIEFAHNLIDHAGIDIVHGHSSHHVKGIEVYRSKLILYGCGDFLNDYEGISGYEMFRDDLSLMYFVSVDSLSGNLIRLQMIPTQIKNFKVNRASSEDALWLTDVLNREGIKFGTSSNLSDDNTLTLRWN